MFNALSMAAAVTTDLKVGTSVCLIGERDPIWTAKQVASLDHLSGGRRPLRDRLRLEPRGAGEPRLPVGRPAGDGPREGPGHPRALDQGRGAASTASTSSSRRRGSCPSPCSDRCPSTSAAGGARSCSTPSASTAAGWMPISARRRWRHRISLLHEACERNDRDPATVEISVFGATTDRAASRASPPRASTGPS